MRLTRFALTCVLALAVMSPAIATAQAQAQTRPGIETFFQNPRFAGARFSPGGKHIAMAVSAPGGRTRLVVLDSENLSAKVVGSFTDADVDTFHWVNDDRLVFSLRDWQTGTGDNNFGPGLFAVSREGQDFRTLVERRVNAPAYLAGLPSNMRLLRTSRTGKSDDVFVVQPRFDNIGNLDSVGLFRVDSKTGRATPIRRPGKTRTWLLDMNDVPRVVLTREGNHYALMFRDDPAVDEWRIVRQFEAFADDAFWPIALDDNGMVYGTSRIGRDTEAVYRFDPRTGKLDPEPVVSLPEYDFVGALLLDNGKLAGVRYHSDAPGTAWFDDNNKRLQQRIDVLLPATVNQISLPDALAPTRALVYSFSDVDPGRYLLFDIGSGKLTQLGERVPGIDSRQMATREMVHYQARDGLRIPAYLTLPRGGPLKNLPLVVLVHGGPWIRGGTWEWAPQSQFLASRGYAVLEPEFRGSHGFGGKHFQAGWKQWGLAMQDDLADGARWAIAQGTVDPKRICIAGSSYGGYATLMGLIKDPELFRCGVEWAGLSDVDLIYSNLVSTTSESQKIYSLPMLVGDRERDAEQLKATSPLLQAARLKQPLLMAYGGADRTVPIEHGTRLRSALEKTNNQVEWVEYTEEGHGWSLVKNRIDFWSRVEKFLDRNIGAR